MPGEFLGSFEVLAQPVDTVLQRVPQGVGARCQAPLVEGHQEPDRTRPGILAELGGGTALGFDEVRHRPIKLKLRTIDVEGGGVWNPLGEDRPRRPRAVRLPLREVDHRLFRPPQVEGGAAPVHGLPNRPHVGVHVGVEELQEEREVVRVALVRRCRQHQEVVGTTAKVLAELVAQALLVRGCRRHAVCFIDDHEVPGALPQAGEHIIALGEIE